MPYAKRTLAEIKATRDIAQSYTQYHADRAYLIGLVERLRPYVEAHRLCILDYAGIEDAPAPTTKIDALIEETKP